jgi:hypothetical protein
LKIFVVPAVVKAGEAIIRATSAIKCCNGYEEWLQQNQIMILLILQMPLGLYDDFVYAALLAMYCAYAGEGGVINENGIRRAKLSCSLCNYDGYRLVSFAVPKALLKVCQLIDPASMQLMPVHIKAPLGHFLTCSMILPLKPHPCLSRVSPLG